jgi:hypothetical protein
LKKTEGARRQTHLGLKQLANGFEEFTTYIDNNAFGIVNYGERRRCQEAADALDTPWGSSSFASSSPDAK